MDRFVLPIPGYEDDAIEALAAVEAPPPVPDTDDAIECAEDKADGKPDNGSS